MKGKRLKSLSGTVLIMVLTVMLVLIIMLMATLTVVTTASQRIYTKYEEQQAYYTARSALDVFTNMLNDSKYGNTVGGTFETQGYNIQKSLYDIKAQSDPTGTNPVKNTNPYAGASGIMATQSYIEYSASLPDLNKGAADEYGKFDDGTLKIKVEVLDRTLNCGSDGTPATGKRAKDAMKLKITATTSFEGIESSVAMTLNTKAPATTTADRAVTVTGGGTMNFNNTSILGGIVAPVNASMGNDPCVWGNVFIGDGFSSAVSLHTTVTEGEWVYVRGHETSPTTRDDIVWNNSGMDISGINNTPDDAKMPNFFMDGNVKLGTGTTFGATGKEVRTIISGDLIYTQAAGHTFNGDLYVMGNLTVASSQQLNVIGNLYVGGNCDWSSGGSINVTGDMCVAGTVTPFRSGTPPVVNNLTVGSDTGNAAMSAIGSTIPITITGIKYGTKTDAQVAAELTTNNGDVKIDWDGKVFSMSSEQKLYQQYHWYSDISDGTITASEYAFLSSDDLEKLMDQSNPNFEYPTGFERIHEYLGLDDGTSFGTAVRLSPGGSITAPGKYVFDPGQVDPFNNGVFTINAGGEVEIYLKPGSYNLNGGKILVKNGTTVKFYGVGTYSFQKMPIVTEEYENASSTDPLYVGTYGSDGTSSTLMSMPISYYFEGNSEICFDTDTLFVGHVYIPRGTVRNTGSAGKDVSSLLRYNNVDFMTNGGRSSRFSILGSVICSGYDSGSSQCGGVAFVKASAEVSTPGLPCLQFNASQYTRQ